MTAPRPSDGQQQAAAEVHRLAAATLVGRRWLADGPDAEVDSNALVADIAAALAEAARPGQELRERVTQLADELDAEAKSAGYQISPIAVATQRYIAVRLRALTAAPSERQP